ncbi:DUF982 domain-containing protein [Mesorhizobium sp. M0203]|uniref:DUF982 domain-containing protein n=1 Tax=Mesorhizobium sp. M0203 TaxID=2956912 RepID=UPI00333CC9CD
MAAIFDEMEPEEARKAFLAAAEEEGTLRSPLIELVNVERDRTIAEVQIKAGDQIMPTIC